MNRADPEDTSDRERAPASSTGERKPYVPPRLERLGSWSALTLQQSVGISSFPEFRQDDWWWWNER